MRDAAESAPVVVMLVPPNAPTPNVPVVIFPASTAAMAELGIEVAGSDTVPEATVRPLDDVSPPAANKAPDRYAFLHAVALAPRS